MLTPARPSKDDPMFQERMEQFRLDMEDKARNPRNWGIVTGPVDEPIEPPRRGRPRKAEGK